MKDDRKCGEYRSIGFELKIVNNLIRRKLDSTFQEDGMEELAGIQGPVLGYIHRFGAERDIFQKDIEREFNIRRSTATVMLQHLEQKGYVIRQPVEHDARLKKILLTAKAVEHNEMIHKRIQEFNAQLEAGITEKEREQFFGILRKIEENLQT
ncbi:MAG: MarR family transcriptional regulator [Lachnospiraceae bacterium]|nr:MarR family transcriptional regulator [Lachnospiraceae bacterium]